MLYNLVFSIGFLFNATVSDAVEVRSTYKYEQAEVLIQIALPESHQVGFELEDTSGDLIHHWQDQSLGQGMHVISLEVPELDQGQYVLLIKVGEEQFKHLVYQP